MTHLDSCFIYTGAVECRLISDCHESQLGILLSSDKNGQIERNVPFQDSHHRGIQCRQSKVVRTDQTSISVCLFSFRAV